MLTRDQVLDRIIYLYGSIQELNRFCEVRYSMGVNPLYQLRKDVKGVPVYYNRIPKSIEFIAIVVWHHVKSNNVSVDVREVEGIWSI